jgi:predicted TIM-barrel fold metal-dependent hydrolase
VTTTKQSLKKIDVHIHLAGTGCCNSGCWVSPNFRKRHTFRLLRFLHRIPKSALETTIDSDWAKRISELVQASELDYGVVLGFDGVYERSHGFLDEGKSQLIIPPEWVFQVCREHPGLLPGPSINPYRADALKRLEFCIENKAVLIKWLPAAQAIDPADKGLRDFYKLAATAKIPLLIHMGGERTFATVAPEFSNVERLREPLDQGVAVICAHTATRVLGTKEEDQTAALKDLLRQYPHLHVDNSGLCNPSRFSHLPILAKDDLIMSRTLYGSDWPVPSNAFYYVGSLGPRRVRELEKIKNVLDRDLAIKRAFGVPESTLTRANTVLANLGSWIKW